MSVESYPKMDHYLIFKRKDADTVEVSNEIYEMEWEMDIEAARFLHALDGKTDPYKISAYMSREEVNQLLEVFEDEWLLVCGIKYFCFVGSRFLFGEYGYF